MTSAVRAEPPVAAEREYEFSARQELILTELARSVGRNSLTSFLIASLCFGLGAVVVSSNGAGALLASFPLALYFSLAGFWSWKVQDQLKLITDSEGRDIEHLMQALQQLHRFYALKFWAAAAAAILLFALLLAPRAAGG
ncbi:MAG: hypothetical protein AAGK22_26920 [Acidobacteriota bacterium]